MRKPLIAGNWKMNKTIKETVSMINEFIPMVKDADAEVLICPTAVCLSEAVKVAVDTNVKIGAQNMYHKESGAYTGEISPIALKELRIEYVILGHSERRQYFKESDEDINKKISAALDMGMRPILCVGETIEQKEAGETYKIIKAQVSKCLADIESDKLNNLVIAYEPVWAIGTGKNATKEDANDVISHIRKLLADIFDDTVAQKTRILYGGSVKSSNIKELMEMSDIDGALVGGASLLADEFSKIVKY